MASALSLKGGPETALGSVEAAVAGAARRAGGAMLGDGSGCGGWAVAQEKAERAIAVVTSRARDRAGRMHTG